MKTNSAGTYEEKAQSLGAILDEKNRSYGNSWADVAGVLGVLFPNGIPVRSYRDAAVFVRMYDKMKRIANSDDTEDAHMDLAGYAVLLWSDRVK